MLGIHGTVQAMYSETSSGLFVAGPTSLGEFVIVAVLYRSVLVLSCEGEGNAIQCWQNVM